jgi:hypothetical protein
MICKHWCGGSGEHLCQTVEDGHKYHIAVVEERCANTDGHGGCVEPYEMGPERKIMVRAWDLSSALRIAAVQPMTLWDIDGQRETDEG